MSEETIVQDQPTTEVAAPVAFNPFDDNSWSPTPIEQPVVEAAPVVEPKVDAPPAPVVNAPTTDYNSYVKEKFGYDSEEVLAQELSKLKEKRVESGFANEDSKQLFEYLKAGKKDEVFGLLQKEMKLNRLLDSNVDSVAVASEIIKTALQAKYSDLSEDEVQRKFEKQFLVPEKPKQAYDQSDTEYEEVVASWERQKSEIEKDILIEGKIVKKELYALKTELKLPNISNEQAERLPTQEELLEGERMRASYEAELEAAIKSFNGFTVTAKSEGADLPVSFIPTDAEKAKYHERLFNFSEGETYLEKRWTREDKTIDAQKAMRDLYVLENYEAIFQKVANESAAKMLEHYIKKTSNISLDTGAGRQQTPVLNDNDTYQKEVEAIWSA